MFNDIDENFIEKVTLFDEEFIVKKDVLIDSKYRGFHNGLRVTKGDDDKFEGLRDVIVYYEDNFMSIKHFIENTNYSSKMWVKEDPDNRFVVPLSDDAIYWQEKGIHTVPQLRHYLDKLEVIA